MTERPVRPEDRFLVFGAPAIEEAEIREVVDSLETGSERVIFTPEPVRHLRLLLRRAKRRPGKRGLAGEGLAGEGRAGGPRRTGKSGKTFGRLVFDLADKLIVPDLRLGWAVLAFPAAQRLLREEDVRAVYTTSPPASCHLLGLALKLLSGKPWVLDLRDPWTFEPLNRHLQNSRLRLGLERRMERLCFARADAIIANTPEAAARYEGLYPEHAAKIQTITNGFDAEEMARATETAPGSTWRVPGDDRFLLSHVGAFSRYTSSPEESTPHALLEALGRLLEEGVISAADSRVVFAGALHTRTRERIRELGLDHLIETPGLISHPDALGLMYQSDLLLLLDTGGTGKTYVRGKLYEYLGSGRPVLGALPEGAARNLLERSGRGILVSPESPEEIERAIAQAKEQRDGVVNAETPEGLDLQPYERRRLAGLLARTLDAVCSPGSRGA